MFIGLRMLCGFWPKEVIDKILAALLRSRKVFLYTLRMLGEVYRHEASSLEQAADNSDMRFVCPVGMLGAADFRGAPYSHGAGALWSIILFQPDVSASKVS